MTDWGLLYVSTASKAESLDFSRHCLTLNGIPLDIDVCFIFHFTTKITSARLLYLFPLKAKSILLNDALVKLSK